MARREAHSSVASADVRGTALRNHDVLRAERGSVFAIASADGAPRLWGFALDAALGGFEAGLASEGSPAERLQAAMSRARGALVDACNALVERRVPDAHVCAVWFDHGQLLVSNAGNCRVYLHREGRPERITERDHAAGGLLNAPTTHTECALEPTDLVLAGSESSFSTTAIGRVATVLQTDESSPTSVLSSLLTEPARKAGIGAAAVAVRIF